MPGAARSDLWNSLWSLWYTADAIAGGAPPWRTGWLGWPDGGVLFPADPLNALMAAPLVWLVGPAVAYAGLVFAHLIFAGVAAHCLGRAVYDRDHRCREGAGLVAGVGYACAPIVISAVHNGTSEAIAAGWLPLSALYSLRCARGGRWWSAGAALGVAAWASWYGGLCAGLFWVALLAVGPAGRARRLLAAGALAAAMAAPLALVSRAAATHPENLVGIKTDRELSLVRRSTGVADPRGWFVPGDWRSPDFRRLSAYGEDFVHCHYLGWVLLIAAGAGWRRGPRRIRLALALEGAAGAAASMGPVVVLDGRPLILDHRLAIPLPWFALERLPGLSSLSLLFRLAAAPALAAAVLAGGAATTPRRAAGLAALFLIEVRLISPVSGLPEHQPAALPAPLFELAAAPEGAVMNAPVVGGRPYLYEQVAHRKPIAGDLNFASNPAAEAIWRALARTPTRGEPLARGIAAVARRAGVRYLIVHDAPRRRPDPRDEGLSRLREALEPLGAGDGVEVYRLW